MTEEIRVAVASEPGTKLQWAKGLFYRGDGVKKTIIPRNVAYVGLGTFAVLGIMLCLQGPPEAPKDSKRASSIPAPAPGLSGPVVEHIPEVGSNSPATAAHQNEQRGKSSSKKNPFSAPQLIRRPMSGKIPPASMLKAVLLSGASNGPVRAQVTDGLIVDGETMIPDGAILLGSGQSGSDRLTIRFTQMVFPDGAFESVDAQACDGGDKIPGLKGSKIGTEAWKLAGGIGLGFIGGMSAGLQSSEGQYGAVVMQPTLKNALLNGAETAALDQSREMMSEVKNKPPTIEVPAGTPIFILFSGGN